MTRTGASDADLTATERRSIAAKTHGAYRADIDGLRALAVLPVVLYHAGVRGFGGGFVGVDVFFVISGYLITGILVRDIAVGRHTITEFYRRRILRIFPALMAVVVATTIVAPFMLLPGERDDFARSLAATALFVSNIQFYWTTDYFNLGAGSRPLLHTWSLAVEEQWYIVWPIVLAMIGAVRQRAMLSVAIGVTAVSFGFSLWLLQHDSAAAFYLAPPRAWELALGAIVAMTAVRVPSRWLNEALAVIGIALILIAVKQFSHDSAFPGWRALLPVVGAALLLWTGQSATLVGRLLSLPPLRFVGLISYSLYLWHWPVIVFAENGLFLAKTPLVIAGMVGVSIGLATLSWWFVERPFRTGASGWPTPRVLIGAGAVIAATLALALVSPLIAERVIRFTPRDAAIASYIHFDGDAAYRRGSCFQVGTKATYDAARCLTPRGDKPVVLLVGDSHAAQYWPGLSAHSDRFQVLQATATGCVAMIQPASNTAPCASVINGALRDWLATHRPARLILASRWTFANIDGLETTLRDPAIRAANPVVIGPVPEYSTGLPRLVVFANRHGDPGLINRGLSAAPFAVDRQVRAIAARTGTPYISITDLLCSAGRCRSLATADIPMQFDATHLTPAGSRAIVSTILPRIAP